MLKVSRLILILPVIFFANMTYAVSPFYPFLMSPCTRVIFHAGWFWGHQGINQDIDIDGLIGDRFTVNHHYDNNIILGLGYFINAVNYRDYNFLYGVNAFYLAQTFVKGLVVQEHMFENLSYRYKVTNWPVYATARAFIPMYEPYPYQITLDLGLGANFVQAGHLKEYTLDGGVTIPDNPFANHTTSVFSAMTGIGLQLDGIFECGYKFFYLGQGRLNSKTHQILNTFKTGQGYAHAIVCSLSA